MNKKTKQVPKKIGVVKILKFVPLILTSLFFGVLASLYMQGNFNNSTSQNINKAVNPNLEISKTTHQLASASGNLLDNPTPKPEPTQKPVANPIPAQAGRSLRIPILNYHYVGNNPNPVDKARDNLSVTPDKFDEQMGYLSQNGYQSISFDTMYAALGGQTTLPAKAVIITFDDGYIDFYINAYPILKKYNLHAVSFIPTGLIGTSYYMSWEQIREIDSSGLVFFQAHSVTHPSMVSLSDDALRAQIIDSKKTLEIRLGKPVNTFAYPFGVSDGRVWQAVKNAGFIGAVGTWGGNVISEGTIYNMPRLKIPGNTDLATFASKL